MYQGNIQPVPMRCTVCGNGPWQPQISEFKDYRSNELVTEASWRCGCCGANMGSGEISREPIIGEGIKHDKITSNLKSKSRKFKTRRKRA